MSTSFDGKEAQAVARALAAVAAADGAVLGPEESFIDGFVAAHAMGGHAFIGVPLDVAALAATVRQPEQRREVVRLCLTIALADRDYAPEEHEIVARIARALDVSDDDVLLLTAAVRDQVNARRRA